MQIEHIFKGGEKHNAMKLIDKQVVVGQEQPRKLLILLKKINKKQ